MNSRNPTDKTQSSEGYVDWLAGNANWPNIAGLGSTPSIAGGQNITIPTWTAIIGRHTRGGNRDARTLYALLYSQSTTTQLLQPGDVFICARIGDSGNTDKLLLGNGQVIGGNVQLKAGVLFDNGKVNNFLINMPHRYGNVSDGANYGFQAVIGPEMTATGTNRGIWSRTRNNSTSAWGTWGKIGGDFTGTTSEYIRGDGSRAAFPSIPAVPTGANISTAALSTTVTQGTAATFARSDHAHAIPAIPTGTDQKTNLASTDAGNSITAGTIGVQGTLPITSGGTGQTTASGIFNMLMGGINAAVLDDTINNGQPSNFYAAMSKNINNVIRLRIFSATSWKNIDFSGSSNQNDTMGQQLINNQNIGACLTIGIVSNFTGSLSSVNSVKIVYNTINSLFRTSGVNSTTLYPLSSTNVTQDDGTGKYVNVQLLCYIGYKISGPTGIPICFRTCMA